MTYFLHLVAEIIKGGFSFAIALIFMNAILGLIGFLAEDDYKMSDKEKATIKRSLFFCQIFIIYLILINLL